MDLKAKRVSSVPMNQGNPPQMSSGHLPGPGYPHPFPPPGQGQGQGGMPMMMHSAPYPSYPSFQGSLPVFRPNFQVSWQGLQQPPPPGQFSSPFSIYRPPMAGGSFPRPVMAPVSWQGGMAPGPSPSPGIHIQPPMQSMHANHPYLPPPPSSPPQQGRVVVGGGSGGTSMKGVSTPYFPPHSLVVGQMDLSGAGEDPRLSSFKSIRKHCPLRGVPVDDAIKHFKDSAEDGLQFDPPRRSFLGAHTRLSFEKAYVSLLENQKEKGNIEKDPPMAGMMPNGAMAGAIFTLFDRDNNMKLDLMELICGVALLCKGDQPEKLEAIFHAFDENEDGFISMDEMFTFLVAVFKVVLTPSILASMKSMGVHVQDEQDLASITATECFQNVDLNHDGRLSKSEFQKWFKNSNSDPAFMFSPLRKMINFGVLQEEVTDLMVVRVEEALRRSGVVKSASLRVSPQAFNLLSRSVAEMGGLGKWTQEALHGL